MLCLAASDLRDLGLDERDCVVGIAASGRTPYVLGSLHEARRVGALTGAIACCRGSKIGAAAELAVEVETGPEVLIYYHVALLLIYCMTMLLLLLLLLL